MEQKMQQIKFIKDEHDLSEDYLDHKDFAGYIEKAIEIAEPPFTMALYGSWGTGKTCLLKRLKDDLNEKNYKVIWFDAWKYENEPNLLWPLLKKLQLTAPEDIKKESLKLFKSVGKCALNLGLRSAIAIGSAGTISYGIEDVKKQLEEEDSALDSYVDEVALLEKEFNEYVDLLLKNTEPKKLIILIDDLDRCAPENMVALIEGIKLFLYTGKCIFVYALDKKVVSEAVTRKYEGMESFDGERYLEKIFEFSFKIPPPKEEQFGNITSNYRDLIKKIGIRDDPNNQNFLQLLRTSNRNNPRVLKRFFNKLILLDQVLSSSTNLEFANIAWMFIFEFWPEFRKMLNEMEEKLLRDYMLKIADLDPSVLKRYLDSTEPMLQQNIPVFIGKYPDSRKFYLDPFLYNTLRLVGLYKNQIFKEAILVEGYEKTKELCEKYSW